VDEESPEPPLELLEVLLEIEEFSLSEDVELLLLLLLSLLLLLLLSLLLLGGGHSIAQPNSSTCWIIAGQQAALLKTPAW